MINWFRPELSVLFVCTANVCRSPLAEAMLRRRLKLMGLGRRVGVGSAGTRVIQQGRPPDPRVVKLAAAAGLPLGRIRARALTMNMVQQSDYILVMEHRHLRDIEEMLALSPPPEKVLLLGSFLPGAGSTAAEIPDPYFGDAKGFSEVFDLLDDALEHLLENVLQQLGARTD